MVQRKSMIFELDSVRWLGAAMLGAAELWPLLPKGAGIPCPLRSLTGIPCPFCGMTTSVVDTVHGHLGSAVIASPLGIGAVLVAIVLIMCPNTHTLRLPVIAVVAGVTASWTWQIIRVGELHSLLHSPLGTVFGL